MEKLSNRLIKRVELLRLNLTSLQSLHERIGLGIVDTTSLIGDPKDALVDKLLSNVSCHHLTSDEWECLNGATSLNSDTTESDGVSKVSTCIEDGNSLADNNVDHASIATGTCLFDSVEATCSEEVAENVCIDSCERDVVGCLSCDDLNVLSLEQLRNIYIDLFASRLFTATDDIPTVTTVSDDFLNHKEMLIEHLVSEFSINQYDLPRDIFDIVVDSGKWMGDSPKIENYEVSENHVDSVISIDEQCIDEDPTEPSDSSTLPETHFLQFLSVKSIQRLYLSKKLGTIKRLGKCGEQLQLFLDRSFKELKWSDVM